MSNRFIEWNGGKERKEEGQKTHYSLKAFSLSLSLSFQNNIPSDDNCSTTLNSGNCCTLSQWTDSVNLPSPPVYLWITAESGFVTWETGESPFGAFYDGTYHPDEANQEFEQVESILYFIWELCSPFLARLLSSRSIDNDFFLLQIYENHMEGTSFPQYPNGTQITQALQHPPAPVGFYNLVVMVEDSVNGVTIPLDFLLYLYPPMHYCSASCDNSPDLSSFLVTFDNGNDGLYGLNTTEGGTGSCRLCGGGGMLDPSLTSAQIVSLQMVVNLNETGPLSFWTWMIVESVPLLTERNRPSSTVLSRWADEQYILFSGTDSDGKYHWWLRRRLFMYARP